MQNLSRDEIGQIIKGSRRPSESEFIYTAKNHLGRSKSESALAQGSEYTKDQETADLISFIDQQNFWFKDKIDQHSKLAQGAEHIVYFLPDCRTVIKLNDSVYYEWWNDYFNNLLLHNTYFPANKYSLRGFIILNDKLHSVVEQLYVEPFALADLDKIEDFMGMIGFVKKNPLRQDYLNKSLGIILEDLHDENVLVDQNGIYHFIDTVFYLSKEYKNYYESYDRYLP